MEKKVVCFGEVLWDNLPSGKMPGGAPMNVAYHLHKLGCESTIISRLGNDEAGSELISFLNDRGLSGDHCQIDNEHPTSEVKAYIDEHNDVTYDIVYPVAWDFIVYTEADESLVKEANAFVFGSLAVRNQTSFETLLKLLQSATYRVMDVNLREPHYTKALIAELLKKTDLLKLNLSELNLISEWFNYSEAAEENQLKMLQQNFGIKEFIVTKGSSGAAYYSATEKLDFSAYPVIVKDTVGSGDSFLAAFLSKKINGFPIQQCLKFAMAVAAYVTTQSGACPDYNLKSIDAFLLNK